MTSIDPDFLERIRRHQEQFDKEGWEAMSELDLRGFDIDAFRLHTDFLWRSNLTGTTLRNSLLARANVTEAVWREGGATTSSFYRTDLSRSILADVTFTGCDFVRTEMWNCSLRDVAFVDCNMMKTSLRNSDLQRVTFENCVFDNSWLSDASFSDCAVTNPTVGRLAPHPGGEPEIALVGELRAVATGEQVTRSLIAFDRFDNE